MKVVLVTGATGAIGSEVSRRFVSEDGTQVRLLLRASSPSELDRRLGELFRFWGVPPRDEAAVARRVNAFAGDVTQPRLGLDDGSWERMTGEVTHVIHSAGNVKLNNPMELARQSAVDSTRHVLSFIDACRRRSSFQKLEFVSTVGVGGLMPGDLPERPVVDPRGFRNSYEAAKAEAEAVLLQEIERGLPATIHRPSMVVGDSRTGRIIRFQVFYHLCEFLSGARTLGVVPDFGGFRLDIIPVDYVARAIQISTTRQDAAGRVFHLCSAHGAPTLSEVATRVRRMFAARGRPMPALRSVPLTLVRTLLPAAGWCVGSAARRALRTLPYFLAYLDSPQTFVNAESRAYFDAEGLALPPADSYIEPVLSYYLAATPARP